MKLGRAALAAIAAVAALGLAACGADAKPDSAASSGVTGSVTVFAASSLTEAFTQIGKDFEAANPGVKVTFNFAGSPTLANQITQGAATDVFAAASPATMKTVTDAGDAADPVTFVKNQLVIAVPKGNPKGIASLVDIGKPGVKVAVCAEQVPCGAAAKKVLEAAVSAKISPVTQEPDVKSALAKLKLGEVDAALVYRTDAKAAAADVDGIEFSESAQAINAYPIAVLNNAPNRSAAEAFVAWVRSSKGMAVLTQAGFQAP